MTSSSSRLAPSPDSRAAEREEQDDPQSSNSNSTSSRFPWFSSTASNSSSSSTASSSSSRTNPNIHSNPETVRASLRAHPDGHEELDSDARKPISTATVSLRSQAAAQTEADTEVVEEEDHSTDASHLACYFLAGGAAGATSRTVVSPLERLKIIMQVQPHSSSTAGSKSKGGAYSGVISGLSKMWREEGMKGFMRGNGINCLRIFPYSAVQFTTYESAKSWLRDSEGELTVIRRLAAGGFAGIASVVSTYPLDLVRSRISIASASLYEEVKASTTTTTTPTSPPVSSSTSTSTSSSSSTSTSTSTSNQSSTSPSPRKIKLTPAELRAEIEAKQKMVPGIWKMTVKVYREEGGIRGLYRGCVPTSAGVMPYVSLNFIGYEYLRKRYAKWTGEFELDSHGHQIDHISAMGKLACGALAGSFSQTLTYPLDVLRRRMQVAGMKDSNLGYNDKNSFDCIRTIMRAEGFKGLYRGLLPNLLKVAPSIGTSFCTYELVRDGLERYFASYNQTSSDTRNHN